MAESRPGETQSPHIGANYAQPSASASALPGGDLLDKNLNWSGRRFEKSPFETPDTHFQAEQIEKLNRENHLPYWAAGNFGQLSREGQRVRSTDLLRFFGELREQD